jgi:hypothetical protein
MDILARRQSDTAVDESMSLSGPPKKATTSRPRATTRPLWWSLFVIILALAIARTPVIFKFMNATVSADAASELEGTNLQTIAISVAVAAAILVFALTNVMYMSFGAFLERRFLTASIALPGGQKIGGLFLLILAIGIPTQVLCLVFGWPTVPRETWYFACVGVIAMTIPFVFFQHGVKPVCGTRR